MNDQSPQSSTTALPKDATNWALYIYLSVFAGFLIPLGNIIVPTVLWIMKRDLHQFVNTAGKEVINFQISVMLCFVALFILMMAIGALIPALLTIFPFLYMALAIAAIVFVIMGAVKTADGKEYVFPYSLRLIK